MRASGDGGGKRQCVVMLYTPPLSGLHHPGLESLHPVLCILPAQASGPPLLGQNLAFGSTCFTDSKWLVAWGSGFCDLWLLLPLKAEGDLLACDLHAVPLMTHIHSSCSAARHDSCDACRYLCSFPLASAAIMHGHMHCVVLFS